MIADNIPTEIIECKLPEADRLCPIDGKPMPLIRWEESAQLDHIPSKTKKLLHGRAVDACPDKHDEAKLITASSPQQSRRQEHRRPEQSEAPVPADRAMTRQVPRKHPAPTNTAPADRQIKTAPPANRPINQACHPSAMPEPRRDLLVPAYPSPQQNCRSEHRRQRHCRPEQSAAARRSRIYSWLAQVADLTEPLYWRLEEKILASKVISTNDAKVAG